MADSSVTTVDHGAIQAWAAARGARPGLRRRGRDGSGEPVLALLFKGEEDGDEVSWDDFFARFDADRLAFEHSPQDDPGRGYRLVSRVDAES